MKVILRFVQINATRMKRLSIDCFSGNIRLMMIAFYFTGAQVAGAHSIISEACPLYVDMCG